MQKFLMENRLLYLQNSRFMQELMLTDGRDPSEFMHIEIKESKFVDFSILNPQSKIFKIITADDQKTLRVHYLGSVESTYTMKAQPTKIQINDRCDWINKPIFYDNCYISTSDNRIVEI